MKYTTKIHTLALSLVLLGSLVGVTHAATIIASDDFTASGVIIVDDSSSLHQFTVSDPADEDILSVSITVNLSASGDSIAPDGTIITTGDTFLSELILNLIRIHLGCRLYLPGAPLAGLKSLQFKQQPLLIVSSFLFQHFG